MPTRKIADERTPCFDPDHNPPSHRVYQPGTYEHTCRRCGKKTVFKVRGTYCSTNVDLQPMAPDPRWSF